MISLEPITPENQRSVRELSVREDQRDYVATVEQSLADAYIWKESSFRAAYLEDSPVGYILVFPFTESDQRIVNIVRLMIDAEHQGTGLGRALLRATLEWIEGFTPTVDKIRISSVPENQVALSLYRSEGFEEAGIESGEVALYRSD